MVFVGMLPLLFLYIGSLLSRKSHDDCEQSSPYECGFSPFQSARHSFSIHFFLLSILFVVFDIELVILMPVPFICWSGIGGSSFFVCVVCLFLLVLFLGLIHEWREGSLDWY